MRTIVGGVLVALALCGALFLLYPTPRAATAEEIVATCAKEPEREQCYEREVPALYPARSLAELFTIIRAIRVADPSYQFCHVLAHKLGENAVAEDPSQWIGFIPENPADGLCSNGFIHGVIVGRFRNDTLDPATLEKTIPDFKRACEPREDWSPTPLDQAICYHGMGHLFMFITNADIRASLDVCDRVTRSATGDFSRVCREGVFMQIYQPLEPDDFALIELLPEKPTPEKYRALCAAYGRIPEEEGACLREAWPLFREDILFNGGAEAFCRAQPTADEETACYETVFAVAGRQLLGKEEQARAVCSSVPSARKAQCFAVIAQSSLEENRSDGRAAVSICTHAGAEKDACMQLLATRAPWIFGADEERQSAFCRLLPEEFHATCLK